MAAEMVDMWSFPFFEDFRIGSKTILATMRFFQKQSPSLSGKIVQEKPITTAAAKRPTAQKQFGHQSTLPDILYPLSFAGPLTPLWVSPRLFFSHPWVLYSVGFLGVMVAGACFPLFTFIIGRWMNGITDLSKTPEEREHVGTDAAILMLGLLLAAFLGSFIWFICCASIVHLLTPPRVVKLTRRSVHQMARLQINWQPLCVWNMFPQSLHKIPPTLTCMDAARSLPDLIRTLIQSTKATESNLAGQCTLCATWSQ
jgi:hypothetical protein